jgi:nucleoside-diphosphate-sugar epimerase
VKRRASIDKARKVLGYESKSDMQAGLKRTYEWILENRDKIGQVAGF